ncbi:MAG: glycine cleavage system protein H, partial [Cyanobacteria bacterium P01_A01_bin.105]
MALEYPEELSYTDTHEYARIDEEEKLITIGISAFAIDQLGDVVFLELPDLGD